MTEDVRDSAIEVQLAAYGFTQSGVHRRSTGSGRPPPPITRKRFGLSGVWVCWQTAALGRIGIQVLSAHLKNLTADRTSLPRARFLQTPHPKMHAVGRSKAWLWWEPLQRSLPCSKRCTMIRPHIVRERAACSLAESGMLSHHQRLIAVPQLIDYSDDPALDAQTHAWAFQALGDITRQRLPNDSAAWRNWYQNNNANN